MNKLATALTKLKEIQDKEGTVIEGSFLNKEDKEILIKNGILEEIIKGWFFITNPTINLKNGDSSLWFYNFWLFLSKYLNKKFGKEYSLNPDDSLLIHSGYTIIPKQLIIIVKNGSNYSLELPNNLKLVIYNDKNLNLDYISQKKYNDVFINVFDLEYSILKCSPSFYKKNQIEAEISIKKCNLKKIINILLSMKMETSTNRFLGALKQLNKENESEILKKILKENKYNIKEINPFEKKTFLNNDYREQSPYCLRIRMMWNKWRQDIIDNYDVIENFNAKEILDDIIDNYKNDAYHSLSIEGYKVSDDLIQKVSKNEWNPDLNENDREFKNALAARGYYLAFEEIKKDLSKVFKGEDYIKILKKKYQKWFIKLFEPSLEAGILSPHMLLGFRNFPVIIQNSSHSPLPYNSLIDVMETYFDLMEKEKDFRVQAILGHHIFTFIHPYPDGNGRLGRFIMNFILASNNQKWKTIKVKDRTEYMNSLEEASVYGNIIPFTKFIFDINIKENKINKNNSLKI